ncbi:MAG: DUF1579 family protein [Bacteroidetes bacterium]|nr:DUF1579 family protein [Fibrella sp.]
MKALSLTLLISSLLIQVVFGQQPIASTSQKAPAHGDGASAKPNPAPDKFRQLLARSNGAWTGHATMTFAPDAPPMTSTSTLTNSMAMGGLYQVSEINYTIGGKRMTGIRVTGYDATKKIFTRAMIQDGGNGVAMEGPWDEATRSITFLYKQLTSSGREDQMKEVYTIADENTEVLEIYRIDPQTRKEFKILNVKWSRDN